MLVVIGLFALVALSFPTETALFVTSLVFADFVITIVWRATAVRPRVIAVNKSGGAPAARSSSITSRRSAEFGSLVTLGHNLNSDAA